MQFIFESIEEVNDFMTWAGYERAADRRARDMERLHEAVGALVPASALRCAADSEVPDGEAEQAAVASGTDATPGTALVEVPTDKLQSVAALIAGDAPAPEKPPRKRRTKVEIEADKAAEVATNTPADSNAPTDAQASAATSPLAGANPFDASTSNTAAAAAALNEAPAGTTNTLNALANAQVEAAVLGESAKPVDPQVFIELRVAEMGGEFDAREHMKKCVEFIGALGKARYDEAFALAGTSRSVATYTPAECAKHIAALEFLQLSGTGA